MTDVHDDRRSALDQFAAAPQQVVPAPSVAPMASPGDRVFGAQQVAVYRDESRVLQKLAALGAAAGDDWFYRFPVKNKNGQRSFIEGASIKLANDVARIYGNCEVDTRVIDLGSSWLIYARFTDFETGYALTRPFQQDKGASRLGGDDDARRRDIAFQIGVSKAIRNVVVNALQTYADFAFDAARNSLIEKIGKDVAKWREKTLAGLANHGVDVQRVEFVIGRASGDWTAPDIAKIIAMMKAIADGMATLDETFPPKDKQVQEQDEDDKKPATEETGRSTGVGAAHPAGDAAGHQPATGADSAAKTSTQSATSQGATNTSASGQADPKASNPPKVEAKGSAKASDKSDKSSADFIPTSEAQYVAFANAWINALTDAGAGESRWTSEKNLRNKCNVSSEERDKLRDSLTKKVADINDADRS